MGRVLYNQNIWGFVFLVTEAYLKLVLAKIEKCVSLAK